MFRDRREAGQQLADRLAHIADEAPVVVGLPRGGVVVAAEIAARLQAPLDVVVVRKIGCPWQPELGLGAIAEGDVEVLNEGLVRETRVSAESLATTIERERAELTRRVARYRGRGAPISLDGRVAIVVDDGLATGYTTRAAIEAVRRRGARRVVLAIPVGPEEGVAEMERLVDEVVVLATPAFFFAIGEFYADFDQTSDEEVVALLAQATAPTRASETIGGGHGRHRSSRR